MTLDCLIRSGRLYLGPMKVIKTATWDLPLSERMKESSVISFSCRLVGLYLFPLVDHSSSLFVIFLLFGLWPSFSLSWWPRPSETGVQPSYYYSLAMKSQCIMIVSPAQQLQPIDMAANGPCRPYLSSRPLCSWRFGQLDGPSLICNPVRVCTNLLVC